MTTPESPRAPLDLRRPRDLGALIADGFGVYLRNFGTFVAIAAAVVVPVRLVVDGIGLGQLTAGYDSSPDAAQQLIPVLESVLLIGPLTTAMCIYALLEVADGRKPRVGASIQRGLDVFAPLLAAYLLYVGGVALGLLALIVPGIYLLVRWYLVIQATVIDGRRGPDGLRRASELVEGTWWRAFGVLLAANILLGGLSAVVGIPFLQAAESTGNAVFQLVGSTLGGVLFAAPAALISTLFYYDLRARKGL